MRICIEQGWGRRSALALAVHGQSGFRTTRVKLPRMRIPARSLIEKVAFN
jgi:hypothetical protein